MKKKSTILCLLALIFGAGMMLSSCKDNETASDVNPDEEVLEKGSEKGEALLSILSMTAELDSLPDDWYKNTYTVEPTIGTVKDEANPYVRYIAVSDSADAYTVYKSMVSENLTGTVKDETWIKDGIGSLAFKVVKNQADLIATVDVNVQQMPHLKQICFVPATAMGDNSSLFAGDPFYQFGDVVKDKRDGTYWFCARPASKTAGKSTTHWVSFNILNTNFEVYTKNGYAALTLPADLGNKAKSEEHILNFMKFMYAAKKGSENDLTLSGVTLPKEDIKAIYELWKSNNIEKNEAYIPEVFYNHLENLFNDQNINIFYYGHCSGKTPDVHMLTTQAPNFGLNKQEIKFEWPKAAEYKEYSFVTYMDGKPNSTADLANLVCKIENFKMPEKAIIMRYKTGPQLSGQSSLFGNDKYPGQSYTTYTNGKIEDIFVSSPKISEMSNIQRIYCLGSVVKPYDLNSVCVKSASSFYFGDNDVNKIAIFISPTYNPDVTQGINDEQIKILMFHMLNAGLNRENALDFSSNFDYSISLKAIAERLSLDNFFDKIFSVVNDNYYLRLHLGNALYRLEYNKTDHKYKFRKYENQEDEDYPRVTILYCEDNSEKAHFTIEDQPGVKDINKSADEGAKLYKNTVIE